MTRIAIKRIVKVLLIFVVVGTIFGVFKIELVLRFVDFRAVRFLRLTSELTLFVSTIFSFITLAIIILAGFFTLVLAKSDTTPGPYSESVVWLVWMYSLNEIAKTFIFYFSIPRNVVIKTAADLLGLISNPTYRLQSTYSDIIFILTGIVIYAILMKKKDPSITPLPILISSAVLCVSLIFSHFI